MATVAAEIGSSLLKAANIFSESGLAKLTESVKDGTTESLIKLKNKIGVLSNFKENYASANSEMQQKILKSLYDNDVFDEAVNSIEGKRLILDDIRPGHGLEMPEKPAIQRNNSKESKKQWAAYDKALEEYNNSINDFYDTAEIEGAVKQDEFDAIVKKHQPYQNIYKEFGPEKTAQISQYASENNVGLEEAANHFRNTKEPTPTPKENVPPNAGGQWERIGPDPQLPATVESNERTGVVGTYNPQSTNFEKSKLEAFKQERIKQAQEALKERHNQRSAADEAIRQEKEDMGFFRRIWQNIHEISSGKGESTNWIRGRNTRKEFYDGLESTATQYFGNIGTEEFKYNKFTNNFKGGTLGNIHDQFTREYINRGGVAAGIKGGLPTRKKMINNPDLMANMMSGQYFNSTSSLDGIPQWMKDHQLAVAGGIAAASLGAGVLIGDRRDGD